MPTQIITQAIAGPFKAFYAGPAGINPASASLGVIGDGGIRQKKRIEIEEYSADLAGNSTIEGVYMGGQCFLELELEEANLRTVTAICNQFKITPDAGAYDQENEMGVPGTFVTAKAGSIILMPLYAASGTVHTSAGNQVTPVRTYGLCAMAAGFEIESLYASKRKKYPIRLRCYPYADASSPAKYIWYSLSALDGTYRVS